MATTFTAENATEALILEQALAYARQLARTATDASDGQVLRAAEACVLARGRALLRQSLEIVLQAQAEGVEKKGAPSRTCRCGTRRDNKGKSDRQLVTAIGTIRLARTYFVCPQCRDSGCPLDDRIGLTDSVSPEALRLIVLAGGSWSFDAARDNLSRFCGVKVSDELIRQRTEREGPQLAAFAASAAEAATTFRTAPGAVEFETDATKVNTVEGWRDAKIGILVKRPPGAAATIAEWNRRPLPDPTARFAFAAIAESEAFATQWVPLAKHLGIDPQSRLSVVGDGADWIWNRTAEAFPKAQGVLDIFHSLEYVSDAAKAYFVNAAEAVAAATTRGRELLLGDGYAGVVDWIGELSLHPQGGDGAALGGMLNYLAGHQTRLPYALRLRRGQTIGSGLIEGAAKNLIGRRLKANNARWVPENVNRIAGVCCAVYSETWDAYWESN